MSGFASRAHLEEALDDWAAEEPLAVLREGMAEYLTEYRLDAVAVAEPAAALIYAADLLTDERRIWCEQQPQWLDVRLGFTPDRLERERRTLIARARGEVQS